MIFHGSLYYIFSLKGKAVYWSKLIPTWWVKISVVTIIMGKILPAVGDVLWLTVKLKYVQQMKSRHPEYHKDFHSNFTQNLHDLGVSTLAPPLVVEKLVHCVTGSAVTILLVRCVASILISASIIPISIFRFWLDDFRFSDSKISIIPILGFDILFLGTNCHQKWALGLFSVSI